jgi:hypothetical protein
MIAATPVQERGATAPVRQFWTQVVIPTPDSGKAWNWGARVMGNVNEKAVDFLKRLSYIWSRFRSIL